MSVEETDKAGQEAADVGKGHRITLAYIQSQILSVFYTTGDRIAASASVAERSDKSEPMDLRAMTLCMMVMKNGFIVFGKSAPVSPQNYDQNVGRRFAYEECIRQLWPLYAFAYKEAP